MPDLSGGVPRYRFACEPGESARDLLIRIAAGTAFAFTIDPAQADEQPDMHLEAESYALPDGVVVHARARMRLVMQRDAALVAATGADQLFVFFLRAGRMDATPTRSGRPVEAGDILIVDLAQTSRIVFTGYEYHMAVIGRAMLPAEVRNHRLNGVVIPRDHPLGEIVTAMVERLHASAHRMTAAEASAVLRHIGQLLGRALPAGAQAGEGVPLKARVEALVDDELPDPALSPAALATRLGVSRATLYRAFEQRGIRALIARRRIERAWTLLASDDGPAPKAVAVACGFRTLGRLDAALIDAFGADAAGIRASTGADREALATRANAMMDESWDWRIGRQRDPLTG